MGWYAYSPDYGGPPDPIGVGRTEKDAIEFWLEKVQEEEEREEGMTREQAERRLKAIQKLREMLAAGKLGAMDERGCRYRLGGKFCAVGALMTEKEHGAAEGQGGNPSVTVLFRNGVLRALPERVGFDLAALQELQASHDQSALRQDWAKFLGTLHRLEEGIAPLLKG